MGRITCFLFLLLANIALVAHVVLPHHHHDGVHSTHENTEEAHHTHYHHHHSHHGHHHHHHTDVPCSDIAHSDCHLDYAMVPSPRVKWDAAPHDLPTFALLYFWNTALNYNQSIIERESEPPFLEHSTTAPSIGVPVTRGPPAC